MSLETNQHKRLKNLVAQVARFAEVECFEVADAKGTLRLTAEIIGIVAYAYETEDDDPANMFVRAGYLQHLAKTLEGDDREMCEKASRSLMHVASSTAKRQPIDQIAVMAQDRNHAKEDARLLRIRVKELEEELESYRNAAPGSVR